VDLQEEPPVAEPSSSGRRSFVPGLISRHKALSVLLALVLVLMVGVGSWVWVLNSKIDDIPRFPYDPERADRPSRTQDKGALNVLLVGVDGRGRPCRARRRRRAGR